MFLVFWCITVLLHVREFKAIGFHVFPVPAEFPFLVAGLAVQDDVVLVETKFGMGALAQDVGEYDLRGLLSIPFEVKPAFHAYMPSD